MTWHGMTLRMKVRRILPDVLPSFVLSSVRKIMLCFCIWTIFAIASGIKYLLIASSTTITWLRFNVSMESVPWNWVYYDRTWQYTTKKTDKETQKKRVVISHARVSRNWIKFRSSTWAMNKETVTFCLRIALTTLSTCCPFTSCSLYEGRLFHCYLQRTRLFSMFLLRTEPEQ